MSITFKWNKKINPLLIQINKMADTGSVKLCQLSYDDYQVLVDNIRDKDKKQYENGFVYAGIRVEPIGARK